MALSAARRAALQQLGYELIVNVFGKIVETVEMLQSTYTTLETITPHGRCRISVADSG